MHHQTILTLESTEGKLHKLANPARASTSNHDSGYGSHDPKLAMAQDVDDYDAEDDVGYGSGPEDEAAREGEALLWREREASTSEGEPEETPATSPSKRVLVIPATPADDEDEDQEGESEGDDSEDEEEGGIVYRAPSPRANDVQNRRISFSDSVRISGGIRSKSRRHRRPPPFADLFSPQPLPPNATERTPPTLYSHHTARNPSVSSLSNSRSNSPSRPPSSHGVFTRNLSSSSLLPLHNTRDVYSVYSSSPTSQLPSRSSSPCSSIYAPLQAPKSHCPAPGFVRLTPKRKAPSSGISFKDYLRGRDSRSDGESDEEVFRGYRELVERQRRKKERWEKRRLREQELQRGTGSFWSKVTDLLAVRAAGAGMRGGVGYGSTATTLHRGAHEDGRTVKGRRSRLSISSEGADDSSDSDLEAQPTSKRSRNSAPKVKTEVDVRFGTAPGRWFTRAWWSWKVGMVFKSLEDLLEGISAKEASADREAAYQSL